MKSAPSAIDTNANVSPGAERAGRTAQPPPSEDDAPSGGLTQTPFSSQTFPGAQSSMLRHDVRHVPPAHV